MVQAQDAQHNGKAVAKPKTQSPLDFFEHNAQVVWTAHMSPDEKALKLYSISDSIHKYLQRAQVELANQSLERDSWSDLSCRRSVAYLEQLALDLRRLAIQCQNEFARKLP